MYMYTHIHIYVYTSPPGCAGAARLVSCGVPPVANRVMFEFRISTWCWSLVVCTDCTGQQFPKVWAAPPKQKRKADDVRYINNNKKRNDIITTLIL